MKLKKMRAQDFRCVLDSRPFNIAEVTCLVGKNESGKTTILHALHRLKPDRPEVKFAETDYPRLKWTGGDTLPADPPVIWTEWHLDDAEMTKLEAEFGAGALTNRTFEVTRGYGSKTIYSIESDEETIVKHIISHQLAGQEKKSAGSSKTIAALTKYLGDKEDRTDDETVLLTRLKKQFASGTRQAVLDFVHKMMPTFLYFDEYLTHAKAIIHTLEKLSANIGR